ncbi:hypothetical protein FACS18945_3660 [Bacteroidia bacterium]|nr:hypothetical protein FACS18945_3660 [Bacteroidia bacterium]
MAEREKQIFTEVFNSGNTPNVILGARAGNPRLRRERVEIEGLKFWAIYDNADKLVFVLDDDIDEAHPNAVLVLNPDPKDPTRKWDDILENDFGADLTEIRPKKNNKFQKLDIEYEGLPIYNALIVARDTNGNVAEVAADLSRFRDLGAKRAALERLRAAEKELTVALVTQDTAQKSAAASKAKVKEHRKKLTAVQKTVGKRPNKETAAKILKFQSQVDSEKEKEKRSLIRARRAQRRVAAAKRDIEQAKKILDSSIRNNAEYKNKTSATKTVVNVGANTQQGDHIRPPVNKQEETSDVNAAKRILFAPAETVSDDTTSERDMEENKEVQPLFGTDPKIVDENIAFRPIEFNDPTAHSTTVAQPTEKQAPRFDQIWTAPVPAAEPIPVPAPAVEESRFVPPVLNAADAPIVPPEVTQTTPVPEYAAEYAPNDVGDTHVRPHEFEQIVHPPMPPAAAPYVSRPVNPSTGEIPVHPVGSAKRKGMGGYYLALSILILLSILTLWLYQKKMTNQTPDLIENISITTGESPMEPVPESHETGNPFVGVIGQTPETEQPLPEDSVQTPVDEQSHEHPELGSELSDMQSQPEALDNQPEYNAPAESWEDVNAPVAAENLLPVVEQDPPVAEEESVVYGSLQYEIGGGWDYNAAEQQPQEEAPTVDGSTETEIGGNEAEQTEDIPTVYGSSDVEIGNTQPEEDETPVVYGSSDTEIGGGDYLNVGDAEQYYEEPQPYE